MDNDPTNSDDVIDSRNIERRIDELDAERGALVDALDDAETDLTFASHGDGDTTGELTETRDKAKAELDAWDASEEADELKALKACRDEFENYCPDWYYGTTLIRDSYWKEYAQEFADDIGAVNSEASWPNNCIDWDKAARELQMDYTSGEFDGVTYWAR